jgi:hypothetical protein
VTEIEDMTRSAVGAAQDIVDARLDLGQWGQTIFAGSRLPLYGMVISQSVSSPRRAAIASRVRSHRFRHVSSG